MGVAPGLMMAKSVKYVLTQPFYTGDPDDPVVQPGEVYDSESAVPEGARVAPLVVDSDAAEPKFHPVDIPFSRHADEVAASAPPAPKDEPKAAPKHESSGGKAGARA